MTYNSLLPLPETPTAKCNPLGYKPADGSSATLELRVRNHPGTMSHITGLFARRAFNLEAIVCVPVGDGAESCMLLLVANGPSLDQVEKQLLKLYDVLTVRHRPDLGSEFFSRFSQAALAGSPAPSA
jgi:acetolactate synthase I/III small subunit